MPRQPKATQPPKPWQRAEAGRYRSSDERFTLESDGAGRWFVTDSEELDELGLARTTGPFATLDVAKAAADESRGRAAAESPLAARIAEAKARPKAPDDRASAQSRAAPAPRSPSAAAGAEPGGGESAATREPEPVRPGEREPAPRPKVAPAPPPRSWLDDLADRDPDAARRARALVAALLRDGIGDAEALVRRDVLGDRPAVASRLLARDILAAIARLKAPTTASIAEAIAGVIAASPRRRDLPGWELVERAGRGERARPIRVTGDDLAAAAGDRADLEAGRDR